jgi:UDPglucose--hexose-1-phosphate uridylyltransferase
VGIVLRVLLVEDSADDARLLVRQLTSGGYEVQHERVESPAAMRAALTRASWDLVISDYSMPGFSGTAALNLLQQQGVDVPFIFVSGTIGEDVAVAAMKAGASDYVLKDKLKRLIPAIERELRDAEMRRERRRAHEIVVESPDHRAFLGHQPVDQIDRVLRTLLGRFNTLVQDTRIRAVVVFKNHGAPAGTSLHHPHWQIIATPVVPRLLRIRHAIATDYFDRTGRCVYCDLLEDERAAWVRVIAANDHYTALLPYASHSPFQIRILPRVHRASFGRVPEEELRPLALILREVLSRLHAALGDPAFNLTINTAPRGDEHKPYYLWHVEIIPRLTTPAGFELGCGMSINTVLPEEATRILRQAVPAP